MNTQSSFFPAHLLSGSQRLPVSQKPYIHRLDKNEQPDDVPEWLKMQVLQKAMNMEWNRYPALSNSSIERDIAATLGMEGNCVLLGSGSATFITALLNFFGMQRRQIVIAQPSYSLFDYHCKSYGIPYLPWQLNASLEYDEANLPVLEDGSVLFVVSPNNPVGNTIPRAMLERILISHPRTLVILDAVYAKFDEADFGDLLQRFENLIMMRSFSKELPVAGLRLGYLCGHERNIDTIRKLMLPFTINPLSLAFAKFMMFDPEFLDWAEACRSQILTEKDRMYESLKQRIPADIGRVYPSSGNFLLIRIYRDDQFQSVLSAFENAGIKVLDTSSMPMLENTFRISVGSYEANCAVVECVEMCGKMVGGLVGNIA